MTNEDCPALAREPWASIGQAGRDETSHPAPVRRLESPQRQGKGTRLVGLPTGVERRSQQAMAHGLGPIFAPACSASSCGCRPGRWAHQAVKPLQG